jgi:outer membrane biosynthesis protein TonB
MALIADDTPGDAPPADKKKILGMPRTAAYIVGAVLFIGIAWFYFKSKQPAAPGTTGGSGGSIIGYDANGNPIYSAGGQMPADFAGEISTLQSEYGNLASEIAAMQGSGPKSGPPPGPLPHTQPIPAPPPPPKPRPTPQPAPKPSPSKAQYVTVAKWTPGNTPWNSTLSGIAAHYHTTVAKLLQLNPGIKNPNVISANQKIRVSLC